eukprot:76528-Rhodomonas_salina.1
MRRLVVKGIRAGGRLGAAAQALAELLQRAPANVMATAKVAGWVKATGSFPAEADAELLGLLDEALC